MISVFWDKLPQFEGQFKLKFSIDGLKGFKIRRSMKKYLLYKEA